LKINFYLNKATKYKEQEGGLETVMQH